MIRTAVVIAGGRGERLMPLTADRPKAMVEIAGRPLLHWVLLWLRDQGIRRVGIGVAYQGEKIIEYIERERPAGLDVVFSQHTLEGGTAEGFRRVIERAVEDDDFLAMNCDEITNLSVARFEATHRRLGTSVTMALAPFFCRFSVVELASNGLITGFRYGRRLPQVPVSIGIYLFKREICALLPERGSIEDLLFTRLAEEGRLGGHPLGDDEVWVSVNDMKNIREAEEALRAFGRIFPTTY
jgi:NDP-sugar pyrophosphorylase family protein